MLRATCKAQPTFRPFARRNLHFVQGQPATGAPIRLYRPYRAKVSRKLFLPEAPRVELFPFGEPECKMDLPNGGHRCPDCKGVVLGICGTGVGNEAFSQPTLCSPCSTKRADKNAEKLAAIESKKAMRFLRQPSPTLTNPRSGTSSDGCSAPSIFPLKKRITSKNAQFHPPPTLETDSSSTESSEDSLAQETELSAPRNHSVSALMDGPSGDVVVREHVRRNVQENRALKPQVTIPSATKHIKKTEVSGRTRLTFQEKLAVLTELESGKPQNVVADSFGIGRRTVARIKKDKDHILTNSKSPMANQTAIRRSERDILDCGVLGFILFARQKNLAVASHVIKAAALRESKRLAETGVVSSEKDVDAVKNFKASNNWLRRFLKRHGLNSVQLNQEEASASELTALAEKLKAFEPIQSPDSDRLRSMSLLSISEIFAPVEELAQQCNVAEVSHHLQRAKQALIRAKEAQRTTWQSVMEKYFQSENKT